MASSCSMWHFQIALYCKHVGTSNMELRGTFHSMKKQQSKPQKNKQKKKKCDNKGKAMKIGNKSTTRSQVYDLPRGSILTSLASFLPPLYACLISFLLLISLPFQPSHHLLLLLLLLPFECRFHMLIVL